MFACRMARAFTRREKILKFEGGWHGLHDYAMVGNWRVPSEAPYPHPGPDVGGIPRGAVDSVLVAPFNDLDDDGAHRAPSAATTSPPSSSSRSSVPSARCPASWPACRDLAQRLGALLIFDEVVTGFRLAYGGAQEHYGVVPDLAVYGKAHDLRLLAGGHRRARRRHGHRGPRPEGLARLRRRSPGTLSGNALACAAGVAALGELRRPGVYPRLHALGERLRTGHRRDGRTGSAFPSRCWGTARSPRSSSSIPRAELTSDRALRLADGRKATRFALECVRRGIFTLPGTKLYLSLAHTDADVDWTLDAMEESLRTVA